ncbi:MAG: hypothetical protein JXA44_13735 [Methanospirillaceae archaeon]|nr:hypothetical protein [Methanospirillaceae archaeon]
MLQNRDLSSWNNSADSSDLCRRRIAAIKEFLPDDPKRRQEGRYTPRTLPYLCFQSETFAITISSHCSFTIQTPFRSRFICSQLAR